ncbi:hypothetical protein AGMMS49941_07210 [Deferribacterales bacterium]|nr:hypothetical protein AGMMS49941_07210 [Deferribacterales bacterium]
MARIIGLILSIIIVLSLLTIIILPYILHLNSYKPQIEQAATAAIGKEVRIEGDLQLRIFPRIRLVADKITIQDIGSTGRLSVAVKLFPLRHKECQIVEIFIDSLNATYSVDTVGKSNIADIINKTTSQQTAQATLVDSGYKITLKNLEKVRVRRSSLTYSNANSGSKLTAKLNKIEVRHRDTNHRTFTADILLLNSADVAILRANLYGRANDNAEHVNINVFDSDIFMPNVGIDNRIELVADAAYTFADKRFNLERFTLNGFGVSLLMSATGDNITTNHSIKGRLDVERFSPLITLNKLGINYLPADSKTFASATMDGTFELTNGILRAPINLNIDNTSATLNISANFNSKKTLLNTLLTFKQLNLDKYIPSQKYTNNNTPLLLKKPNLDLQWLPDMVAELQIDEVKLLKETFRGFTAVAQMSNGNGSLSINVDDIMKASLVANVAFVPSPKKATTLSTNLTMNGIDIHRLVKVLNGDNTTVSHLPQIGYIQLTAILNDDEISLKNINLKTDNTSISAGFDLTFQDEATKPHLTFHLITNSINLKHFISPELLVDNMTQRTQPASGNNTTSPIKDRLTPTNYKRLPFAKFMTLLDADGYISSKSVRLDSIIFRDISADISLKDGTAKISPLSATLCGGSVEIDATMYATPPTGTMPITANVLLKEMDVADTIESFAKIEDVMRGKITATGELGISGIAPAIVMSSLTGELDYVIDKGVIMGIGYNPNLITLDTLKSISTANWDRAVNIDKSKGKLIFRQGLLELAEVAFNSKYIDGELHGLIDINSPDKDLDINGTIIMNGVGDDGKGMKVPMTIIRRIGQTKVDIDKELMDKAVSAQIKRYSGTGVFIAPVEIPKEVVTGIGSTIGGIIDWMFPKKKKDAE